MKILILSDIEGGGEWIATQNIIEELKKEKKYDFHLVTYGKKNPTLNENLFEKIFFINHAPLIRPFRYYRQLILEFISGLKKLIEVRKKVAHFDSVFAANEYLLFLTSYFVFPFSRKIFSVHGLRHRSTSRKESLNLYLLLRISLERFAWLVSQKLIVPSEKAKATVKKQLGIVCSLKKIEIIPNIISDFFTFKHSKPELINFRKKHHLPIEEKIVLYCGRIDKVKGIENLLEAYALLQKKIKSTILVIAYTDAKIDLSLYSELQSIIKNKNIAKSVYLIKNLPRINLPLLYQNAACAVFPSFSEMDSLALREALASGAPTFSTNTGNAKNLLGKVDNFFILDDNKPQTILNKLINFFNQDAKSLANIKNRINFLIKNEFKNQASIEGYQNLFR